MSTTKTDQADWLAYRTFRSPAFVVQLMLFIAVVVGIFALVEIEREQLRGAEDRKQLEQIARDIRECVKPNGLCAKRGERVAAEAVANINRISIYASYCASIQEPPVSAARVELCVNRQLGQGPA